MTRGQMKFMIQLEYKNVNSLKKWTNGMET